MLAKFLNNSRFFYPTTIVLVGFLALLVLGNINLSGENQLLSLLLFMAGSISWVYVSYQIRHLNKSTIFTYFFIGWIFIFSSNSNFEQLDFYSGFFILSIVLCWPFIEEEPIAGLLNPFDVGLFSALSVVLYPPLWVFTAFLGLYYLLQGKVVWRLFLMFVLGVFTITLLGLEIISLLDYWVLILVFLEQFNYQQGSFNVNLFFLIPILLFVVLAIIRFYSNIQKVAPVKRRYFMNILLLLSATVLFAVFYDVNQALLIAGIPVSLMLTNWVIHTKMPKWQDAILISYLLILLFYKYHQLITLPAFFDRVTF